MNNYSVIVFDLGNVLLSFDYTPFVEKLNKAKAGLGDRVVELYKKNYNIHREFEAGKLTNDQFLKIMMEWTEGSISEEKFCIIFSNIFIENKNVVSLLPRLKEKYKLVLLSNTNEIHKKYGWENYDFLKYFDKLCLSHKIGAVKPEGKIYKYVEQYTLVPPLEHLFIDDIADYAEGARKAGWDAIQFTGYDNLIDEFKIRNIL